MPRSSLDIKSVNLANRAGDCVVYRELYGCCPSDPFIEGKAGSKDAYKLTYQGRMRQRIMPYLPKFHGHLFAKILGNIIFAHAFEQHCCLASL